MTLRLSQASEQVLIQPPEDSARTYRVPQMTHLALIVQAGPIIPPALGSGISELAIILQEPKSTEPAFVAQSSQMSLIEESGGVAFASGVYSQTVIQDGSPPNSFAMKQVMQTAIILQEGAPTGTTAVQSHNTVLLSTEAPPLGTIAVQSHNSSLVLTEGPSKDVMVMQTMHLALHLDINSVLTLINASAAINTALVQEEEPTLDPHRLSRLVMLSSTIATANYPTHVQSATFGSSLVQQTALQKTLPQSVQSLTLVRTNSESIALQHDYLDPSTLGSFLRGSSVISNVAVTKTLLQPATLQSNSNVINMTHLVSCRVDKINPVDIVSSEQISNVNIQAAKIKLYGPPSITSASNQSTLIMPSAIRKLYAETVQSNSLTKKLSRLVSKQVEYTDLAIIRSTVTSYTATQSTCVGISYQDPDTIRPILSLSGMTQLGAYVKDTVNPIDIISNCQVRKSALECSIGKTYIDPNVLSPNVLLSSLTVVLTAHQASYGDPINQDVARRDAHGTYYTVLDN